LKIKATKKKAGLIKAFWCGSVLDVKIRDADKRRQGRGIPKHRLISAEWGAMTLSALPPLQLKKDRAFKPRCLSSFPSSPRLGNTVTADSAVTPSWSLSHQQRGAGGWSMALPGQPGH